MLYYDRIDLSETIDVAKNKSSKECIVFYCWNFSHEFKFQNQFLMVVKISCCVVLILAILPLSLLKAIILFVLFMILANQMQFIYRKIMCLMIVGI